MRGGGDDSKDFQYQGQAYGGGLSLGYQFILARRWNLELELGVGYARINYDQYDCRQCGTLIESGHTAPWAARVTAIDQSNVPDNQKDAQIQALNNGTTYAYLLAQVYPSLRRVDYRVNYRVRQEAIDDTRQVNQATAALENGKWDEVLPLLDRVEEQNEYYYNTLGRYHLLTGQYEQAQVALERAASMGLTQAQANVHQLALALYYRQLVAAEQ